MDERNEEQGRIETRESPEYLKNFKENCQSMRAILENNKRFVMSLMEHPDFRNEQTSKNQHGEMKANVMLCYRHLEDARMRMGKAIQAYDGGKSIYPK
ncbi:MAG: hypothetical protein MUO31_13185 [Thermodesulfovibrionales bacterium]|nr:hypothetical protein [Thermodesulfovibrionales bacterium]